MSRDDNDRTDDPSVEPSTDEPALVKVHVSVDDGPVAGEYLWAEVLVDEISHYRLASIPFFVSELSLDDVVLAHPDPEFGLEFVHVARRSEQITVGVIFTDPAFRGPALHPDVARTLDDLHVARERAQGSHFSLSVHADHLGELVDRLESWQLDGLVDCHSRQ